MCAAWSQCVRNQSDLQCLSLLVFFFSPLSSFSLQMIDADILDLAQYWSSSVLQTNKKSHTESQPTRTRCLHVSKGFSFLQTTLRKFLARLFLINLKILPISDGARTETSPEFLPLFRGSCDPYENDLSELCFAGGVIWFLISHRFSESRCFGG